MYMYVTCLTLWGSLEILNLYDSIADTFGSFWNLFDDSV